jgi:hypothetical protein
MLMCTRQQDCNPGSTAQEPRLNVCCRGTHQLPPKCTSSKDSCMQTTVHGTARHSTRFNLLADTCVYKNCCRFRTHKS